MKFFSIGCNETPDTTQTRYGISSIEPLKEGILGGSLRRITKTVIKVVAATLSFFSIGPAHFACSSGSKSYAGSDQSSTQNKSVTKTGKNDKNGKAVFEANGKPMK